MKGEKSMYKRCENCAYCTFNNLTYDYYCEHKHLEVDPDDSCMYFEEMSASNSSSDSDDFDIFGILFACAYFYFLGLGLLEIFKSYILPLVLPTSLIALVLYLMYKFVKKTENNNVDKRT